MQQGQVFELKRSAVDGSPVWAYRYRTGGPGSRRLQRGGFSSERDAAQALERALEHLRRQKGVGSTLTLTEIVNEYLAQHDAEPETIHKLCWLLTKALHAFGDRRLPELRSQEIAAWRMTISPGHRFEATQALRQVLARAVVWGMIDSNPAKQGVDNPQRRRTEKRPFETWAQLDELAARLGPQYGPPVLFAAATGLTCADSPANAGITSRSAYSCLCRRRHNHDLRHTFATFALRAGISTFELSRYMGASLTMIDRHYGHLARDGREHAIRLLDELNAQMVDVRGRSVDAGPPGSRLRRQPKAALSRI